MADIRINALATTATTPASDDYLALDGTAQGTRKILATNIANNVTDVILGSSGPSVKSTLSARAPRQGLVFDGTAGATVASVPAFGTGDFTVSVWVRPNSLSVGYETYIVGGATGCFALRMENTTGLLSFLKIGGGLLGTSSSGLTAGKWALVTLSRSSGSNQFYINGVAIGSAISNSADYTVATTQIGNTASVYPWVGGLSPLIYNRALSAAEVVALYEAGVPAGSDYNTASNTSVLTGANSDFSSAGNWVVSGGTTISGGKLNLSDLAVAYNSLAKLTKGLRYKLTITIDSITAGSVQYYDGVNWNTIATTAGTYTVEFTCPGTYAAGLHLRTNGGNAVLDTALYYQLGLLLAPDAGQAGGGLTWYDTSGNAANITLPASGVTWNVPTSSRVATGWSFGGNVGIGTTIPASSQFYVYGNSDSVAFPNRPRITLENLAGTAVSWAIQPWNTSGDANLKIYRLSGSTGNVLLPDGNVLVGSTVDGGQKLQVSGDAAFAGDRVINRKDQNAVTRLQVRNDTSGTSGQAQIAATVGDFTTYTALGQLSAGFTSSGLYQANSGYLVGSNALYIFTASSSSLVLGTNNTTALTLDASQNATFAGTVKVKNQATLNANAMVNVGTSATSIFSALNTSSANWAFVFGDNGTSGFADLVVTVGNGNAVAVISSATIYGSPPARTYTSSSTNLQLAMASGTMSVRTSSLNNGT